MGPGCWLFLGQLSTVCTSQNCILQVQDDLRRLRCSLEKITVDERGKTLDFQALDSAIRKTESSIRVRMLMQNKH